MRYHKIDGIRGITIISMIMYHACWDLKYLAGMDFNRDLVVSGGPWQLSICVSFILISGFCAGLSHLAVRRGILVFACGALVTLVTVLVLPKDRIVFGVLTFLGSAMIITGLVRGLLERINCFAGFFGALVLFFLTYDLKCGYIGLAGFHLSTYLGFMDKSFFSTDYFAIIPWLFLFEAGYYLLGIADRTNFKSFLEKGYMPPLEWLGRHSLLIYLIHQPVLYLVTNLITTGGN